MNRQGNHSRWIAGLCLALAVSLTGSLAAQPAQDTVSTLPSPADSGLNDYTQLVVSSHGEMGFNGVGGVNLDFSAWGPECDPAALVYLYSGSPYLMQDTGGGIALSYSMNQGLSESDPAFKTYAAGQPPQVLSGANYAGYFTGTFVNWDSSIAMEATYYAPTSGADSANFIIRKLQVFPIDGNSHSNVAIGSVIDWNLPADIANDNSSSLLITLFMDGLFFLGTDVVDSGGCQPNANRLAAEFMLGWYSNDQFAADSCIQDDEYYGVFSRSVDNDIVPNGGLVPADFWNQTLNNPGLNAVGGPADLYGATTFQHGVTLGATDTLTFYTVLVSIRNGNDFDLQLSYEAAFTWYDDNLRCGLGRTCLATGNLDGSGGIDVSDLSALINWIELGGPPPVDLYEADVNGDCVIDSLDIIRLFDCLDAIVYPELPCNAVETCCDPENRVHDPNDADTDGIPDDQDNCPNVYNPDQVGCCCGDRGNVDSDPDDIVDVGDLTYLIGFLFLNGSAPDCPEEADVDGTPGIDIGDLTLLINYLFIGDFLPPCP